MPARFSRQRRRAGRDASALVMPELGDLGIVEVVRETGRAARVALTVPSEDQVRELSVSDLSPAHCDVAEGTRFYSDGIPDLSGTKVSVKGTGARVFIAGDAVLSGVTIEIDGTGGALFIGSQCSLHHVLLRLWGANALLAIGQQTSWQSGWCLCLAGQQIVLGDDCMMSSDVIIRTYDAHAIFDRRTRTRVNAPAPVVLESHVWVGQRSTVSKGTRVGTGSVVGGDSVAVGLLEPSSVYAGVPARKVRGDVAWSRTKKWDDVPIDLR